MEIKENIVAEVRKYIETFEKYDNDIAKKIEKKEIEIKEKREKFNEKWDDDIFPTDIPIRDKEEQQLEKEEENLNNVKQKFNNEIRENETELKSSLIKWENDISKRREELVGYVKDKEKYLKEKGKLEKELKEQKDGIELWEKNGIDSNDQIYRRRKESIIPNLEKQINELDFKLDEVKIRNEYKELGELAKKINSIRMHDRKHMLPELIEIFEIGKDSKEPVKTQEPKQVDEPIKVDKPKQVSEPEPKKEKTNPIELEVPDFLKDDFQYIEDLDIEDLEINGIEMNGIKTPSNSKMFKVNGIEPNKHSASVTPKAAQATIPKQPKAEAEPINKVPKPVGKVDVQPLADIKIGRKIKIRYADGEKGIIANSNEYFKYIRKNENAQVELKEKLRSMLGVDEKDTEFPIDKVDTFIIYGLIQTIERDFLTEGQVVEMIEAIGNKDKKLLNNILPIKWDKADLSKGAFLPWNRKNRDKMVELADRNSDIMDSVGEYEPNPFKRIFNKGKKLLPKGQKQELLTEGSEKIEEPVAKKEKLSEREGIKVSKAYIEFSELVNEITDPNRSKKWLVAYNQAIESGKLTEKEAKELKELYSKQISELVKKKTLTNNPKKQQVQQEEK